MMSELKNNMYTRNTRLDEDLVQTKPEEQVQAIKNLARAKTGPKGPGARFP